MDEIKNDLPAVGRSLSITLGSKTFKIKIGVKTLVIVLCILLVGGLAYYYRGVFVAATVNGSPIIRLSVIQELEKASGKSVLESIINKKLIEDAAVKKGITVGSDELQAQITKVTSTLPQGTTLDAALKAQNMTLDDLKQELTLQLQLEKLLSDKIQVTDADIDAYLKSNPTLTLPKDQAGIAQMRSQISAQLKQQKLSTEAQAFITSLRSTASINYLVNY